MSRPLAVIDEPNYQLTHSGGSYLFVHANVDNKKETHVFDQTDEYQDNDGVIFINGHKNTEEVRGYIDAYIAGRNVGVIDTSWEYDMKALKEQDQLEEMLDTFVPIASIFIQKCLRQIGKQPK